MRAGCVSALHQFYRIESGLEIFRGPMEIVIVLGNRHKLIECGKDNRIQMDTNSYTHTHVVAMRVSVTSCSIVYTVCEGLQLRIFNAGEQSRVETPKY